jgi:type II secretory pathway component PulJ
MRPRGFTLLELAVAGALLASFVVLVFGAMSAVERSAGNAGRGCAEVTVAARFAERFRREVRSAALADVAAGGSEVSLRMGEAKVVYRRSGDGRLERVEGSGEAEAGPRVEAVSFALEEKKPGRALRLLRARCVCAAEAGPPVEGQTEAVSGGRVLILDTALRAEDMP